MLRELGAAEGDEVEEIDILQGGLAHNMTKAPNRAAMIKRVREREFDGVIMSPPCRSFAVILQPRQRTASALYGTAGLSDETQARVDDDTTMAVLCAVIALVAEAAGIPWIIEQPADRSDPTTMAHWRGCEDAPHMFKLREFQVLMQVARPVHVVFPQCALDADSQKFTVLLASRSLANAMAPFRKLQCDHLHGHAEVLAGYAADGTPRTRAAAHYPRRMALLLAKVLMSTRAWFRKSRVTVPVS